MLELIEIYSNRVFNLFKKVPFRGFRGFEISLTLITNKKAITMSVLMEFAMFPTDKGDSVSQYVSRIIKMISESGAAYKLTAMGTIVETDTMDQALEILSKAHKELEIDSNRIYSSVKFDIRKGKDNRLEQKIKSIEGKIGEVNK